VKATDKIAVELTLSESRWIDTRLFFIDNIPVRAYLFCVLLIFAPLSGEDSIAVDLTQPLFSSKANLLDA
jgi:hypothetical protein